MKLLIDHEVKMPKSCTKCPLTEIVFCKDCKYNEHDANAGNASCELFYGMMDQYGFCYRGVRRSVDDRIEPD